jgi:hypothetical protein
MQDPPQGGFMTIWQVGRFDVMVKYYLNDCSKAKRNFDNREACLPVNTIFPELVLDD